jgi:hypothetical protein
MPITCLLVHFITLICRKIRKSTFVICSLNKQEKMATRNGQQYSSNTLRTFRKRQGNFTIFDQQAEFNQYPDLEQFKMVEEHSESANSSKKRIFTASPTQEYQVQIPQQKPKTSRGAPRYTSPVHLHKLLLKSHKANQHILAHKASLIKKDLEIAHQKRIGISTSNFSCEKISCHCRQEKAHKDFAN